MVKTKRFLAFFLALFLIFSVRFKSGYGQVDAATAGWKHNATGWWYCYQDGSYPASKWASIGGKWYHFNSKGYMETGWIKVSGKWYYLNPSGAMATGWVKSGGKWYYMNSSGAMATGWVKSGGKWYYMNSSGAMVTGWVNSGGKKYYMDSSGAMVTGRQTIDGKKYLFDSSGALKEEIKEDKTYELNQKNIFLGAGEKYQLDLKEADKNKVSWSSSNNNIAGVGNGEVFGNQPGSCEITATYEGKQYKCTVNVIDFEFSRMGVRLEPGEYFDLDVLVKGTEVEYSWSSSDETIAKVDKEGVIYAVPGEGGRCDIRVGFNSVNGIYYKSVSVYGESFSSLYKTDFIENNSYIAAENPEYRELKDGMALDLTLLSSGMEKCSDTYYEHPGDMDSVCLDGFNYYFLSDTWSNRVIIFKVPEDRLFNGADVSKYIYCVLGQKDAESSKAGYDLGSLNWPVGVAATVTKDEKVKIFVADAKNDRILVWEDLPDEGANGTPADFSIMQMIDHTDYNYGEEAAFINSNESRIAWPWDLWTEEGKLICTSTQNGYVLIWDKGFPTREDKFPDKVIKTGGTPRTITCKDNILLIGDHNIVQSDGANMTALRVFNDYENISYEEIRSKNDDSKVLFQFAENPGDFTYWDGNSGQPSGLYLKYDMTTKDGKVIPKGTLLLHEAGAITVWKDGKIDNVSDRPDYYIGGSQIDADDYYYFLGGDICSLVQDEKGNLFSVGINAGKVVGFAANQFPDEPADINISELEEIDGDTFVYNGAYYWNRRDIGVIEKHCIDVPDICIGAENPYVKTADVMYKYQNCIVVSDGERMLAIDDYNGVVCLWKKIPNENDAKPDMRITFTRPVEDAALINKNNKTGLVIAERGRLYYWENIEDVFEGEYPDIYLNKKIGNREFNYIKSIDYCDGYLYLVQHDELYIYQGIPKDRDEPVKILKLTFKAPSERVISYDSPSIHVTKCDDGNTYIAMASSTDTATIVNVADILNDTAYNNANVIEGAQVKMVVGLDNGERRYEEVYRSFNGVADALVTKTGKVVLSDGGFGRVIIWNSIDDAVSEIQEQEKKSIAVLGLGSSMYDGYDVLLSDPTNEFFDMAYDAKSIQSSDTFFNAHYLNYDGKYLWVGDYKFSGGIKRFTIELDR